MQAIQKKGYVQATPVQWGAIPYFMEYRDVIAKAPTGTGKTFAFGIPMVEHIDPKNSAVQALVLAPTRELALQIVDELLRRGFCFVTVEDLLAWKGISPESGAVYRSGR